MRDLHKLTDRIHQNLNSNIIYRAVSKSVYPQLSEEMTLNLLNKLFHHTR